MVRRNRCPTTSLSNGGSPIGKISFGERYGATWDGGPITDVARSKIPDGGISRDALTAGVPPIIDSTYCKASCNCN
jgi:hypothetical protein